MVFSSLTFIFIFLPLFLLIYYICPSKLKNVILLLFSLLFYAWGEPIFVLLLIFSSFINYLSGLLIEKIKYKKLILIICLIINISLLGYFKYTNFFIDNLNLLGLNIKTLDIVLPLGISFFTFQAISYVVDVYRKDVKAEHNFLNLLLYISMFPQLIAGPIVKYKDVSKNIVKRNVSFDNFADGMVIFLKGLFKKVLMANVLGEIYISVNADISHISFFTAWLGIASYTLQIYFDFSGYSDMAIGLGKMIGFDYPENFNYPYVATSITDFWRRWHISLSTFFKEYVYIPLGGNKTSNIKWIRNMLLVWLLTGFWHGASFNFIIWGLYYGIILILEKKVWLKVLDKSPFIIKHLYTLIIIMIGWLIFSCPDMSTFMSYLSKLFINTNIIDKNFMFYLCNYYIFIILGILFCTPITKKIKKYNFIIYIIYIILFILTVFLLINGSYNPFLYFRF